MDNYIPIKVERPHKSSPNVNVCMKTVINGEITRDKLDMAISNLMKVHPLLTSVIRCDGERAFFVLDSVKEIHCIWNEYNESDKRDFSCEKNEQEEYSEAPDASKDSESISWQDILLEYDREIFDLENGPLIRFIAIHESDRTILLIVGHHLIGDGMSYVYMVQDLMRLIHDSDTELPVRIPHIIQEPSDIPAQSKLGFLPKLLVKSINKEWRKNKRTFEYSEYRDMFDKYRSSHTAMLDIITIKDKEYAELIDSCHKQGISVNDAVTTAFLCAVQSVISDKKDVPQKIGIGVNIRNDMTNNPMESMGNYVSGISIKGSYDFSKDFTTNAKTIRKAFRSNLNNIKNKFIVLQLFLGIDEGVLEAMQYAAYYDFDNKAAAKLAMILGEIAQDKGIGVTNLGKISIDQSYGKYELEELMFICPASPGNLITFGVSTYKEQMNICVRYNSESIDSDTAMNIIESVREVCR